MTTLTLSPACALSRLDNDPLGTPQAMPPSHVVITPTGSRITTTKPQVNTFDIAGDRTPTLIGPTLAGNNPVAAIVDPAMPDHVYFTQSSGVFPARFGPNGSLVAGTYVTVATNGVWFAMAP